MSDDGKEFLMRLVKCKAHFIYHRGGPSITKGGRLSSVCDGHYGEFFEINGYRDIDNQFVIDMTYLPDIKCGSYKNYYKAGTVKNCGAFNIKDICEKCLGSEPIKGWHYNLCEIYRDNSRHRVKYLVLE